MRSKPFAKAIEEARKKRKLTKIGLSERVNIDPSYISCISRYGNVPSREIVIGLAKALKIQVDELLLLAGYAPVDTPIEVLLAAVRTHRRKRRPRTEAACGL